MKLFSK